MQTHFLGDGFIALWQKVVHIIHDVSSEYDKEWQVRRRVINSMLLVMLIFRLVTSKNSQGYGTTIDELWENCAKMNLPLPQEKSISESSFCVARKKLDEGIFKDINRRILDAYADETSSCRWREHRLFAVDGSKLNLPRSLLTKGYNAPSPNAHYPMGLVSCLYEVLTQTPFDFELTSHGNERICAENHLQALEKNDVVVYDRGYFSYLMLRLHVHKGIHPIFRLQKNSGAKIKNFFTADGYDRIITIKPSEKARKEIKRNYPYLDLRPLKMRVVKYVIGGYVYCLGTTLFEKEDQPYPIADLREVYHARWGVEELYKISKRVFTIENFHAKTVRGVKQEIYAHFTLITMNRFFSNEAESQLNQDNQSAIDSGDMKSPKHGSLVDQFKKIKTNFKNCVHVFTRGLEELILLHDQMASSIKRTFETVIGKYYKVRPNRAFPRISLRPSRKWSPSKEAKTQKKLTSAVTTS
jgi:hypothetical protein